MELSIDTSTDYPSVALSKRGEVWQALSWHTRRNHSAELAPAIRELMGRAKVDSSALEAIFVARGPGGFSALRVGISAAKGLAVALDVPLLSVNTLDVEAGPYFGLGLPVCAIIGAGRNLVYAANYGASKRITDPGAASCVVKTPEQLAEGVEVQTLFCGEAAGPAARTLSATLGGLAVVAEAKPPTRRPAVMAQLGYRRLKTEETDDPESLEPLYLRGSQFEVAGIGVKIKD